MFTYAVDIHDAQGNGGVFQEVNHYYTIPFRCMVPVDCENLLVAGRSICGSSEAALAFKTGDETADVDMELLRRTLVEQGAVIKD